MSSLLIRQDLAPVVVGYLLIMGTLAVGGYLTLMAVVVLYYYGTGCALLLGLSIPVFLAASWLAERTGRRPGAGPIRRPRSRRQGRGGKERDLSG